MVETICNKLTSRIRKEMPDINDERAEVINYGLQLIIGEIPKFFILLTLAYMLGVLKESILLVIMMTPYRITSGGVHLHTHIGCIIATSVFYIGNAVLSKYLVLTRTVEYIITGIVWAFSMIMIKLYAPADTEEVPILRKKERIIKKNLSYITMTLTLVASIIVKDTVLSNLLIILTIFQTIWISKFTYKITNNKYGYEEYIKSKQITKLV